MASKFENLEILLEASKTTPGYTFMKPAQYKPMVKDGVAQINEAITDETGKIACAITQKGIDFLASFNEPTKETKMTASAFEIKTAPIPASTRKGGAGRACKYPFDVLLVGQYFFVPNSEKQPEPAKTLGSVVNTANQKYAEQTGEMRVNRKGREVPVTVLTRKFVVRAYTERLADGTQVAGAGVWREK